MPSSSVPFSSLFVLFTFFTVTNGQLQATPISSAGWQDDFVDDVNGFFGWSNPTKSSGNAQYHGAFSAPEVHTLSRYFQCPNFANLEIEYSIGFDCDCGTTQYDRISLEIDDVTLEMYHSDAATYEFNDMGGNQCAGRWNGGDKVTHTIVNGGKPVKISWRLQPINEAGGRCQMLVWNIRLNCYQIPTPAPTDSPTTKAPTRDTNPPTAVPTTAEPTTDSPTTNAPTTHSPTTDAPTTDSPTTFAPTTDAPTTGAPTTVAPTTDAPTTDAPTSGAPTTNAPTTDSPTTKVPTATPTTGVPTTGAPTTGVPTTGEPTTKAPTTGAPTTAVPTTGAPTATPTHEQVAETSGAKGMETGVTVALIMLCQFWM